MDMDVVKLDAIDAMRCELHGCDVLRCGGFQLADLSIFEEQRT